METESAPESIRDTSVKEIFKPFVYSEIRNNPKVYKGMPKAELLRKFGAPKSVKELFGNESCLYFYYGSMCEYDSCTVTVTHGQVEDFSHFKPVYTNLLE